MVQHLLPQPEVVPSQPGIPDRRRLDDVPTVLDITAGGGSIPFEAGRLGFRTIANELNPVAGLILRATCEWPQKYGWELVENFQDIKGRFLKRVRELTNDLYPEEPQPKVEPGNQKE